MSIYGIIAHADGYERPTISLIVKAPVREPEDLRARAMAHLEKTRDVYSGIIIVTRGGHVLVFS